IGLASSRLAVIFDCTFSNQVLEVPVHRLARQTKVLRGHLDDVLRMPIELANDEFPNRLSARANLGHSKPFVNSVER
ncbi:MAG: hypothetical protein WBP72_01685, partial [Rhodocyclaceae bacterium]